MAKIIGKKEGYEQTYGINRASILRRILAFIVDLIFLAILSTGFLFLSGKVLKYDDNVEKLEEKYLQYGIYNKNSSGEIEACTIIYNDDGTVNEEDSCYQGWVSFNADKEAVMQRQKCDNLIIFMISISTLLSVIILEFVLPLVFKKGRTFGSLLMHIGLIRSDGVKISTVQLFARAIIGRWGIETMAILLSFIYALINPSGGLFGMIIIFIILIAEMSAIAFTHYHQSLHDLIPSLVCVDVDTQYFANDIGELVKLREGLKK